MDKDKLIKSIEEQNRILHKVSENNTHEISSTGKLHTIILNLKVEESKIAKPNGLMPTIKRLQNISKELHDSTIDLVNKDRDNLRIVTKEIQDYSLEMIDLVQAYNNYISYIMENDMKCLKSIKEFTKHDIETWMK